MPSHVLRVPSSSFISQEDLYGFHIHGSFDLIGLRICQNALHRKLISIYQWRTNIKRTDRKWSRSDSNQAPCTAQRSTMGSAQTSTVCNGDNVGHCLRLEDKPKQALYAMTIILGHHILWLSSDWRTRPVSVGLSGFNLYHPRVAQCFILLE